MAIAFVAAAIGATYEPRPTSSGVAPIPPRHVQVRRVWQAPAGRDPVVVTYGDGAVAVAPAEAVQSNGDHLSRAPRCPRAKLGSIAFVHGGALDLLDLRGCRTRTLVGARAAGPVGISPDGRWVSFSRGYVAAGGGAVHPTPAAGTWSPRADVLAVLTPKGGLELVRPGAATRTVFAAGWGATTVAFSPDGRMLAVSRSLFGVSTLRTPSRWHQEIWLVDVATGARREVFHLTGRTLAPPWLEGFSPDGRWLLFWEDLDNSASLAADGVPLYALPTAGGRPVRVAAELHYPDYVTWCGNRLVYVLDHGGREVTLGDGLASAAPPGWKQRVLLPEGGPTSWASIACPTPSAAAIGGGGLVVAGGPSSPDEPFGQEHRSLWLVSPSGGTADRLSQTVPPAGSSDELPMWSGDARWILFVRTTSAGDGSLYAIDPFGGNLVGPLADLGRTGNYYGHYAWTYALSWQRRP